MQKQFEQFYFKCKEQNTYSATQAAKDVGSDLASFRKWCRSKDGYEDDAPLNTCLYYCGINVGRGLNKGELTQEAAEKHLRDMGYHDRDDLKFLQFFQGVAKKRDERATRFQEFQLKKEVIE